MSIKDGALFMNPEQCLIMLVMRPPLHDVILFFY